MLGGSVALPTVATLPQRDHASLVLGDLSDHSWAAFAPAVAPFVQPRAGVAADGTRSLFLVNPLGSAVSAAYLEAAFTMPPGCTGIALGADEGQADAADNAPAAAFELWGQSSPAAEISRLQSYPWTPTGTPTTISTGTYTVSDQKEFRFRVKGRFMAKRVWARITVSSDVWWLTADRIHVNATLLQGNHLRGRARQPRFDLAAAFASVEIQTTSSQIRAELYASGGRYLGTLPGFHDAGSVKVAGQHIAHLSPAAPIGVSYAAVTLPRALGWSLPVDVVAGSQAFGSDLAITPHKPPVGTYLGAIYVDGGSFVDARRRTPIRRCIIVGNSKTVYGGTGPETMVAELLRARGWDVIMAGIGGDALGWHTGTTISVAACAALAQQIATYAPDLVLLELWRNDYAGGSLTPPQIEQQVPNLMDAVDAALPHATVATVTTAHETTETTDSGTGVSWNAVRSSLIASAQARAPWGAVCDLGGLSTSAMAAALTIDSVHPNDIFQGRMAAEIERVGLGGCYGAGANFHLSPADIGAAAWWEVGYGLVGGAMGSVTAGGSSPPSVTVSGSPTLAARLVIEIRVGGTLGVATFDASIDGGKSWVTGLATAASVSVFGLTVGFAAGTYNNLHTYYSDSAIGSVTDLIAGASLACTSVVYAPPTAGQTGGSPLQGRARVVAGSSAHMTYSGYSLSQPCAFMVCAALDANTSSKAILGQTGVAGSGPLLYTNTTSTIAANFGGSQFAVTVDVTKIHTYLLVVNGSSSVLYVDGVPTTGTLGAGAVTAGWVGADGQNGDFTTGDYYAFAIWNIDPGADVAYCAAARMRALYGAT